MTAIVEPTRPKPHSLGAGFALEAHLDRDNEKLLEDSTVNLKGKKIAEPGAINENGRTYHSFRDDKYLLPNDGEEQERLDTQHRVFMLLMDGELNWSPVPSVPSDVPFNVLDIGTGTGKWAIEFAKKHPNARVTGTDLSAIQPAEDVPKNVSWVREDSENVDWTYGEKFDLIHFRMTFTCFKDPKVVIKKALNQLKPGGWIEFQEFVFDINTPTSSGPSSLTPPNAVRSFVANVNAGLAAIGVNAQAPKSYAKYFHEVGFSASSITEQVIPCPGQGNWLSHPKFREIGRWELRNMRAHVESRAMTRPFERAGLKPDEIEDLTLRTLAELDDPNCCWWVPVYIIYAQKPEDA